MNVLDYDDCLPLRTFDTWLDGGLNPRLQRLFERLYADPALKQNAHDMITVWSKTFADHPSQLQLRQAWEAFMVDGRTNTQFGSLIAQLAATRHQRWQRLANHLKIPFPDCFRVYRGVKGANHVRAVLKAWEANLPVAVAAKSLASWSMRQTTAKGFAVDSQGGVIYSVLLPFENTLADKWVDDSRFVSHFPWQTEVISALEPGDSILAQPGDVLIRYKNRYFRQNQREQFLDMWPFEASPS